MKLLLLFALGFAAIPCIAHEAQETKQEQRCGCSKNCKCNPCECGDKCDCN